VVGLLVLINRPWSPFLAVVFSAQFLRLLAPQSSGISLIFLIFNAFPSRTLHNPNHLPAALGQIFLSGIVHSRVIKNQPFFISTFPPCPTTHDLVPLPVLFVRFPIREASTFLSVTASYLNPVPSKPLGLFFESDSLFLTFLICGKAFLRSDYAADTQAQAPPDHPHP